MDNWINIYRCIMARQDRVTLKEFFETNDVPTEEQFAHLIDSMLNYETDGDPFDINNLNESDTRKILLTAERNKLAGLPTNYKGFYASAGTLGSAHSASTNGDWAIVGTSFYVWNASGPGWIPAIGGPGAGGMDASIYDPGTIQANVFARLNHIGTQLASTISDFASATAATPSVSANTAARHTHANKTTLDLINQDLSIGAAPVLDASNMTDLPVSGMDPAVYDPTSVEANVFARANHTGTQLAATISDLAATITANAAVAANTADRHTHTNKALLDQINQSLNAGAAPAFDGTNFVNVAGSASPYYKDPVADKAALEALNTSSAVAYPEGAELRVQTLGTFYIKRGDSTAASGDNIIIDASGNRWFRQTGTGVSVTSSVGDNSDVDLTGISTNDVLVWSGTEFLPEAQSGGVSDHGALTGLADDDHTQYHNNARGDARYSQLGHTQAATTITVTPTGNLASSEVQAALVELQGDIDTIIASGGGWEADTIANTSVVIAKNYSMHAASGNSPLTGNFTINITSGTTQRGFTGRMLHEQGTIPTISGGTNVILNFINTLASAYSTSAINVFEWQVVNIEGSTHYVDIWCYQREGIIYPQMMSATVEDDNPDQVVLVFSEAVTATNLGFTLSGTTSTAPASLSGSGTDTIILTLADAVEEGESPLLSYASSTGDVVSVSVSAPLLDITNFVVVNNVGSTGSMPAGFTHRFYPDNPDNQYHGSDPNSIYRLYDEVESATDYVQAGSSVNQAVMPQKGVDGDGFSYWRPVGNTGTKLSTFQMTSAQRAADYDLDECTLFFVFDPVAVSSGRGDLIKFSDAGTEQLTIAAPYSTSTFGINDGSIRQTGSILGTGRQLWTLRLSKSGNISEFWKNDSPIGSPDFTGNYGGSNLPAGDYVFCAGSGTLSEARRYDEYQYESLLSDTEIDEARAFLLAEYEIA